MNASSLVKIVAVLNWTHFFLIALLILFSALGFEPSAALLQIALTLSVALTLQSLSIAALPLLTRRDLSAPHYARFFSVNAFNGVFHFASCIVFGGFLLADWAIGRRLYVPLGLIILLWLFAATIVAYGFRKPR